MADPEDRNDVVRPAVGADGIAQQRKAFRRICSRVAEQIGTIFRLGVKNGKGRLEVGALRPAARLKAWQGIVWEVVRSERGRANREQAGDRKLQRRFDAKHS